MKKIFTLLAVCSLATAGFSQTVFQSDLSTWATGDPTDWMGTKTNIASGDVTEVMSGATAGTSLAKLDNTTSSHVRFTSDAFTVVPGATYEVKFWVTAAAGEIRTSFFDMVDNTSGPFGNGYGAYGPYIDLSSASGGSQVELSQFITIPGGSSNSIEVILSLRNTDAAGILLDSVDVTEAAAFPITPIYDIQFSTAPDGASPELGNQVKTQGVVTGVYLFGSSAGSFFIQDGDGAWNGIYVFATGYTVNIGDSVTVTGTIDEYASGSQIVTEFVSVSDVTILNSGNALPTPALVNSSNITDEEYEGVLVTLEYVVCTSVADAFGVWMAKDGSGPNIDIDDNLLPFQFNPVLGDGYDVTGIRHYAFSKNLLLPTSTSQIVTVGWAGIDENNVTFSIYPNPANEIITLNVDPSALISIYSISGAVVYNGVSTSTVDVSNLDAGIYTVAVTTNGVTESQRLVIR